MHRINPLFLCRSRALAVFLIFLCPHFVAHHCWLKGSFTTSFQLNEVCREYSVGLVYWSTCSLYSCCVVSCKCWNGTWWTRSDFILRWADYIDYMPPIESVFLLSSLIAWTFCVGLVHKLWKAAQKKWLTSPPLGTHNNNTFLDSAALLPYISSIGQSSLPLEYREHSCSYTAAWPSSRGTPFLMHVALCELLYAQIFLFPYARLTSWFSTFFLNYYYLIWWVSLFWNV